MKTQSNKSSSPNVKQQIKQIEKEIKALQDQLPRLHLTRSAEQDYDVKSKIIDKQAEIIELLINSAKKNPK